MSNSHDNSDITGSCDRIELVVYDVNDDGSFTESGCLDLMEVLDTVFGDEEEGGSARTAPSF